MGRSSGGVLRQHLGSGSEQAAGSSGDVPPMAAAPSASVEGQVYSQVSKFIFFFPRKIKNVILLSEFSLAPYFLWKFGIKKIDIFPKL